MYEGCTVGVVVPAYNEEGFVGEVIETVPAFVDRVYAVDDCSTDGTWAEIRAAADRMNGPGRPAVTDGGRQDDGPAAGGRRETDGGQSVTEEGRPVVEEQHADVQDGGVEERQADAEREGADERVFEPRVVPLRHEENRGVGAAVVTGYRQALADDIDVTAVMNGDGQMDPDVLDRIIDPVVEGRADYAKGDRLSHPAYREGMSGWRLFGNVLLTFLTKIASGYWKMTDPQNGYTAVSLAALEAIDLEAVHERYGFCNDMLVRLNVRDFRIADVPMQAVYGEETSHISYSTFIPTVSLLLLRGFVRRLRDKHLVVDFHPLVFLYALGAGGGLASVSYAAWALVAAVGEGGERALLHGGVALVAVLLSGLLLSLAMVFDMHQNEEMEVHA